ncbi:hypothetical protein ACM7QR_29950 [Pseudomonas aeruginosa]
MFSFEDSTITMPASKPRARPAETERAPEGALSMPFSAKTMTNPAKPNLSLPDLTPTHLT